MPIGQLPPGARGYILGEQLERQKQAQGMGQLSQLFNMQGVLAQQEQARRGVMQEQAFRSELASAKTPDEQIAVATKYGKPQDVLHWLSQERVRRDTLASQQEAARQALKERGEQAMALEKQKAADRENAIRIAAGLKPAPPLQHVVVKHAESETGWAYQDPATGKITPNAPPPASVNAVVRMENSAANQLQRQYNAASNPWRDVLGPVAVYRNARETGDTAQSALMAAEALRRTSRVGSQRFKGEAEAILGGGYRGGSLPERVENFISQELTGTPTRTTMDRLDKLINAAETSALEQMATQTRFYSGQAKGRKLPLQHVTGIPFIHGKKVVFPDGTFAEFKTAADAEKSAEQWLNANPIQ